MLDYVWDLGMIFYLLLSSRKLICLLIGDRDTTAAARVIIGGSWDFVTWDFVTIYGGRVYEL